MFTLYMIKDNHNNSTQTADGSSIGKHLNGKQFQALYCQLQTFNNFLNSHNNNITDVLFCV